MIFLIYIYVYLKKKVKHADPKIVIYVILCLKPILREQSPNNSINF